MLKFLTFEKIRDCTIFGRKVQVCCEGSDGMFYCMMYDDAIEELVGRLVVLKDKPREYNNYFHFDLSDDLLSDKYHKIKSHEINIHLVVPITLRIQKERIQLLEKKSIALSEELELNHSKYEELRLDYELLQSKHQHALAYFEHFEHRLAWPDLEEEERNAGINEEDWVDVLDQPINDENLRHFIEHHQ